MTLCVYFHETGYKTFKDYYERHVLVHMTNDFHGSVSYNRFIELRQKAIEVCHIRRVSFHKVFRGIAQKGKTSVKWFYGFKLHAVINDLGEIIAFYITPGNVLDCNEHVLIKLTKKLLGKLFGDKGYIINNRVFRKLYLGRIHLITRLRKNMKNKLIFSTLISYSFREKKPLIRHHFENPAITC